MIASLSLALCACLANAQGGIYAKFDATHLTAPEVSTKPWFYGPTLGVYYDFAQLGPLKVGGDLRGSQQWGYQSFRSALIGVRLSAPISTFRPYVQGSFGSGSIRVPPVAGRTNYNYSTKLQFQVLGGVDLRISRHWDFRIAEAGYGRVQPYASGQADGNYFSVSTGFVARFP